VKTDGVSIQLVLSQILLPSTMYQRVILVEVLEGFLMQVQKVNLQHELLLLKLQLLLELVLELLYPDLVVMLPHLDQEVKFRPKDLEVVLLLGLAVLLLQDPVVLHLVPVVLLLDVLTELVFDPLCFITQLHISSGVVG